MIDIRHLPEFSCYNHNMYKVSGFKDFNVISEKAEDGQFDDVYIYRKGIIKFNELKWLDEWFTCSHEKVKHMTKEEWENLEIEDHFLWT